MLAKIFKDKAEVMYLVFRVLVGAMFAMHGLQKFGLLGGTMATDPIFIVGGLVEAVGGTVIALGLLTRLAALLSAVEMAVAYAMFHAPKAAIPIAQGGGETALLYLAAMLAILAYGPGKYSVEGRMKKELV